MSNQTMIFKNKQAGTKITSKAFCQNYWKLQLPREFIFAEIKVNLYNTD